MASVASRQKADLYRMATAEHICPFGLKALDLLKRNGFDVADHALTTRAEIDAFKALHGVKTTPQTFIGGDRVGGYDDLLGYFGKPRADAVSYAPVLTLFAMAGAMAMAAGWAAHGAIATIQTAEWFVAFSMCLLALQKLVDIEAFSTMFLGYDLLAQRWPGYATLYPFAEGLAGVLMIAGAAMWLSVPIALFIGSVGALSVFKAVYIDRRALKCACVGGKSNVPLGFVSLTENLAMVSMSLWMMAKALLPALH